MSPTLLRLGYVGGPALRAQLGAVLEGFASLESNDQADADVELTFVEEAGLGESVATLVQALGPRAVVLTTKRARELSAALFEGTKLRHVMGVPWGSPVELRAVLERAAGRCESVSLEAFFAPGAHRLELTLRDSALQLRTVAEVERWAHQQGFRDRQLEAVVYSVTEVVSNAFYDAPTDEAGAHVYAHLHRQKEVTLSPDKPVRLKALADDQRMGFEVEDLFGSLVPDDLSRTLARCLSRSADQLKTRPGGAGLGLFLTLDSMTSLLFDVEHSKRTRVIGLLDRAQSNKTYAQLPRSLHVFSTPSVAAQPATKR